jgi:hypothetical protein
MLPPDGTFAKWQRWAKCGATTFLLILLQIAFSLADINPCLSFEMSGKSVKLEDCE